MLSISMFMFFSGGISFVSKLKHMVSMLLCLEFMVLGILLSLFFFAGYFLGEGYFLLYFITMAVCEGVLGLSLVVSLVRVFGHELFFSMNLLQC